jgi:hypothetical protein
LGAAAPIYFMVKSVQHPGGISMASRNNNPKRAGQKSSISYEQRMLRRNRIIFVVVSVIVLLSMIISLVVTL